MQNLAALAAWDIGIPLVIGPVILILIAAVLLKVLLSPRNRPPAYRVDHHVPAPPLPNGSPSSVYDKRYPS